jgi:hypothetical protein
MSEIMTVAHAKGIFGGGMMDYGRMTRAEIIKRTKDMATCEKEKWEKVLATPDDQFDVRVVRGTQKQELIERLLPDCAVTSTDGGSND